MSLLAALKLPDPGPSFRGVAGSPPPAARSGAGAGAAPGARAASPTAASKPPAVKIADKKVSLKVEVSDAGLSITGTHEEKAEFKKTFMAGPVPIAAIAVAKLALQGNGTSGKDSGSASLQIVASGAFKLGPGGACSIGTVGFFGVATLSAGMGVTAKYSEAAGLSVDAFICELVAKGSVSFEVSTHKKELVSVEMELDKWQLYVVHVGGYAGGKFSGLRFEEGKDLKRLTADLNRKAKAALDAFDNGVQELVDPGGETASEATDRVNRESAAYSASQGEFHAVMKESGLKPGPLESINAAETKEYNAILEVWQAEATSAALNGGAPAGAWRPMVEALVVTRKARRAAQAAEKAAKEKKAKADAEAAAAAALKLRVEQAEKRMTDAWTAMERIGNPLNNDPRSTPGSERRACWAAGMLFRDPGSLLVKQLKSLEGEARIAKADEATKLFNKARGEFEKGAAIRT